jgi:uracil-DNA glycosylase
MEWNTLFKGFNKLQVLLDTVYRYTDTFPDRSDVFNAFKLVNPNNIRAVIVGQDPYSQENVATGLAFANKEDVKCVSPSLQILIDAFTLECIEKYGSSNNMKFDITLKSWAKQGVLLLNYALTVKKNTPGTHLTLWSEFTNYIVSEISLVNPGVPFILFGGFARILKNKVNNNPVFLEAHPSYYYRNGLCMSTSVFNGANNIIKKNNNETIKWYEYEKY